jgi:hypothetical protein
MKNRYLILFFLFSLSSVFSQTGTIKIAKPKPAVKDPVIKSQEIYSFKPYITSNYSFKGNDKIGYEAGIVINRSIRKSMTGWWIGLSYCSEKQYYHLSAYDLKEQQAAIPYGSSQNTSAYLKLPMFINENLTTGKGRRLYIAFGITPEYLLKTKDEHQRLGYSDFRQYNLAGTISVGFYIRQRLLFETIYLKDFFENLKDRNLYDATGAAYGKQKSKTNLISFSAAYIF